MNKRILFVDDEPLVLQGLQRLLRPMRQEWDMEFVGDATQALERLRKTSPHVVISDMMMPGMNGAQLLARVRDESPTTIRLVLSGYTEKQLALQCVGVAHQFLSKPCDAEHLRSTIARVTGLGFAVRSDKLLQVIGELERLPSLPAVYSQLTALLDDPGASTQDVGDLISRDIALTTHVLKIVNSAYFGLAQKLNKPSEAVAYLGMDTLKAVVLTASLFGQSQVDPASGLSMEAEAEHGQKVAAVARAIAQAERAPRILAEECFTAGLLHDVGKLVLACNLPKLFPWKKSENGGDVFAREIALFGASHAEVGGYLLGLWGLPNAVVEATRLHHEPSESRGEKFDPLTAVHVADHFVRSAADGTSPRGLDEAWLRWLGLLDRVPIWKAAAEPFLTSQLANPTTL